MYNFTIAEIENIVKDYLNIGDVIFHWDLQGPQEPMPVGKYNILQVEEK